MPEPSALTLAGKGVLVTGASSGIGRAIALALGRAGAALVLAGRDRERLGAVAREAGEARAVAGDLTQDADLEALAAAAAGVGILIHSAGLYARGDDVETYGRIDMLVNNAGLSMWAPFEDVKDLSIFETQMRVNYLGSVYCTHYALPYLKQSRGQIVGISSLAGRTGVPTRSGYAASKHAMTGFFDSLRIELGGSGVAVTMIYPSFVATEVRERAFGADGKPLGTSPVREAEVMSVEECATIILRAAAARKREVVMTARGKIGMWLKLIAPGLVDRMARRAIERGR